MATSGKGHKRQCNETVGPNVRRQDGHGTKWTLWPLGSRQGGQWANAPLISALVMLVSFDGSQLQMHWIKFKEGCFFRTGHLYLTISEQVCKRFRIRFISVRLTDHLHAGPCVPFIPVGSRNPNSHQLGQLSATALNNFTVILNFPVK